MKKKLIITSVITAALMAAGMVGGTIAYFSTSSETEVNITSAKINVSSVVSDLKTYSLEHEQTAGTFENGGTASLTGNVLTLDRMSPGDKATFKIAITCDNNIKIKYRIAFNKSGDLAPALVANVSGGAADWTLVEPSETPSVINLDASIELPISTGIEYNDKQGQVRILVEAVQGNMPQAVSSAAELEDAIAAIPAEGGEVSLYVEEDITLTQVMAIPSNSQVNLYGDGETTINNASGADRVVNFDEVENSTLTISGVNLHQSEKAYARTISAWGTTNCTINVYDSELTNDSHYPINVAINNTGLTVNVEDSKVEGYCALNVWSSGTVINIKNSTLKGVNKSSGASNAFGVIVINEGAENVNINLENCTVESIQLGDQYETFYDIREVGAVINSANTVYKYTREGASQPEVYESVEKLIDYNSFIRVYNGSSSAYDGGAIAGVQLGDDTEELQYPFFSINYYANNTQLTETTGYLFGTRQALLAADIYGDDAAFYSASDTVVNGKQFIVVDYTI